MVLIILESFSLLQKINNTNQKWFFVFDCYWRLGQIKSFVHLKKTHWINLDESFLILKCFYTLQLTQYPNIWLYKMKFNKFYSKPGKLVNPSLALLLFIFSDLMFSKKSYTANIILLLLVHEYINNFQNVLFLVKIYSTAHSKVTFILLHEQF